MSSPQQQQQLMSPQQQQQQPNTPGPSPGGQQQQQNGGNVANSSPMNAMNMAAAMSTINMSAMNQMMAGNAMTGMTMTGMGNPAGFQQSMGHAMQPMSSTSMPQVRSVSLYNMMIILHMINNADYLFQVQVIQQPYSLPQLYSNAQGQQFFMPGNISLQPTNQTIQVNINYFFLINKIDSQIPTYTYVKNDALRATWWHIFLKRGTQNIDIHFSLAFSPYCP